MVSIKKIWSWWGLALVGMSWHAKGAERMPNHVKATFSSKFLCHNFTTHKTWFLGPAPSYGTQKYRTVSFLRSSQFFPIGKIKKIYFRLEKNSENFSQCYWHYSWPLCKKSRFYTLWFILLIFPILLNWENKKIYFRVEKNSENFSQCYWHYCQCLWKKSRFYTLYWISYGQLVSSDILMFPPAPFM